MKKILTAALLALPTLVMYAQPSATFDATRRDMGTIMWNNTSTAEFTITNSGNKPLIISDVTTACGCTAVKWDKRPILPGKSTTLTVSYDAGMLGHFNKQVAVQTNAVKKPIYLSLYGRVVAKQPDYKGSYNYQIGDIRLDTLEVEFDDVSSGDAPQKEIQIFNAGSNVYKPELMHLPKYLSATYVPEQIRPNHGGKIILTLDSKRLHSMGLTQTPVYLSRYPGDKVGDDNEIDVSAILLPSFSTDALSTAYAPQIVLDTTTLDLGAANGKSKLKGSILISNPGNSTLMIRSLQVSNSALNVKVKTKISAKGQTKLNISVLTRNLKRQGRSRLRVLMITNDPKHPKVIINVKAKP